MLTISEVSKAYGPQILFEDVSLQLNRSDRIGLIGPNGAGKSTLFSLILGTEEPDKGTVTRERNVVVGHLPQECAPAGDGTVLEMAMAAMHAHDHDSGGYELEPKAKRILSGLSFREKDFDRPLREMSGGCSYRNRTC
jgi:ATP-binding cassette, subfamily F, member 3